MRTVIEEQSVSAVIEAEVAIYPRLYEAFDALTWYLSRKPEAGQLVDDYYWLYKQAGDRECHIPALVVLYTFDPNAVRIFAVLVKLPDL